MQNFAIKKLLENGKTYGIFGLRIASLKSRRGYGGLGELLASHQRQMSNFINMLYNHHRTISFTIRTIIDPQGSA